MQQLETAQPSRLRAFTLRHWHILSVGLCLLIAFILGGFSVTGSVLNIHYPVWLMIPWIMLNILLFFASVLLSLPYLFRLMREGNGPGDELALAAMFISALYVVVMIAALIANGAIGFSWTVLGYMFALLVCDIIDIVMGIPQPKEKKQD